MLPVIMSHGKNLKRGTAHVADHCKAFATLLAAVQAILCSASMLHCAFLGAITVQDDAAEAAAEAAAAAACISTHPCFSFLWA